MGIKIKAEGEKDTSKKEPRKGEKGGEVAYDKNVITPDEFDELEKKEKKKIKLKEETGPSKPGSGKDKATTVDMLLLKTEKIEGKLESIAEGRKALEERMSGLNQEIGELRSSIMEKDRMRAEEQSFPQLIKVRGSILRLTIAEKH